MNAVNDIEKRALHDAAWSGYVDVAKALIQNGADVNAVDEENRRHFTAQVHTSELKKDMPTLRKC